MPPQEILTKDSVTVSVDAVVYYNIRSLALSCKLFSPRNPMAAVCNVSDYAKSTKLLASTTLRWAGAAMRQRPQEHPGHQDLVRAPLREGVHCHRT